MDRHKVVSLVSWLSLALALIAIGPVLLSRAQAPETVGDWIYDGLLQGDLMGYAITTAGDVNGDGFDDLVVGAPKATDLVDKEGMVSLFYGGAGGLDPLPYWQAGGGQQAARFGEALATDGDLNGDGYDDLVVGAPTFYNGTNKAGAALVFYGSYYGLLAAPSWSYISPYRDVELGNAVAADGDLNADGYDDLIVASRLYSVTLEREGAVLVFYGSAYGPPHDPSRLLSGKQTGAQLGGAVASGGDVDGDGYDDLLVGAPYYNSDTVDEGAAYLYLGGPGGLAATPDWQDYGSEMGARFGAAVAWAGDINGDGYDDMVVGAPGDGVNVKRGTLHVYYGSADGPDRYPNLVITIWQDLSGFGARLARVGDVNGDGYDDLLAGAPTLMHEVSSLEKAEGGALLYFGSPAGLHPIPGWIGWGDKADASYGFAVGSAGLANSTEFRSIAIGAPYYKLDDKTPLGRAFVHYGPLEPRQPNYFYLPLTVRQVSAVR